MSDRTVGVVIPMFNAARTIEQTLASVCDQTHRDLDIVVVDDGSTDGSSAIVEQWPDPRVRIVRQENAGVAAARNKGAAETDAPYLAFLDADDVWRRAKTEVQLQRIARSPDALVWCWYDEINDLGEVIRSPALSSAETFGELCRWNIIGCGSSMLVSRHAFEQSGGFDTTLRDRDAEGCDDYSFALRVAEKFPMALVRERLVGYRVGGPSMSTNTARMWKSHSLVVEEFAAKHPEYHDQFESNRELALVGYYHRSLQVRDYRAALWFWQMLTRKGCTKRGMRRTFARSWLRYQFDSLRISSLSAR